MTKRKALPRKAVKETVYTYTVLFEPAAEGGYTVTVPMLPGVITEGDTLEVARAPRRRSGGTSRFSGSTDNQFPRSDRPRFAVRSPSACESPCPRDRL